MRQSRIHGQLRAIVARTSTEQLRIKYISNMSSSVARFHNFFCIQGECLFFDEAKRRLSYPYMYMYMYITFHLRGPNPSNPHGTTSDSHFENRIQEYSRDKKNLAFRETQKLRNSSGTLVTIQKYPLDFPEDHHTLAAWRTFQRNLVSLCRAFSYFPRFFAVHRKPRYHANKIRLPLEFIWLHR